MRRFFLFFFKNATFFNIFFGFFIGLTLSFIILVIFFYSNINSIDINNVTYRNGYFDKDLKLDNVNDFKVKGSGKIALKLKENSNLSSFLSSNYFSQVDITNIISTLKGKVNLNRLLPNQEFLIEYSFVNEYVKDKNVGIFNKKKKYIQQLPEKYTLVEKRFIDKMTFKIDKGVKYFVEKVNNNYILNIEKPKYVISTRIISGVILNNLFTDALSGDMKATTLYNMLNEYAFLIDFQRDLHKGDKFIFVVDTMSDSDDDIISQKIIYSNLILSKKQYEIFNFEDKYYDRYGKSVHRSLLKTPIDGARVSSGFNPKRKHPILGFTRAHTGIDLAAPTGTPIYASGDGFVSEMQLNHKGYGKFVTIKHNREYSTRYAHMSRIANIKIGQKVKQRQIIGYVGMTGLATGPHLHYEVIRNGTYINPRTMKITSTKVLDKNKMKAFKLIVEEIDNIINSNRYD